MATFGELKKTTKTEHKVPSVKKPEEKKAVDTKKNKQIILRTTQQTYDALHDCCAIRGITMNDFITAAVSEKMSACPITEDERREYIRRKRAELNNIASR